MNSSVLHAQMHACKLLPAAPALSDWEQVVKGHASIAAGRVLPRPFLDAIMSVTTASAGGASQRQHR